MSKPRRASASDTALPTPRDPPVIKATGLFMELRIPHLAATTASGFPVVVGSAQGSLFGPRLRWRAYIAACQRRESRFTLLSHPPRAPVQLRFQRFNFSR